MKKIELTQGKVALVDDEDFERLNQYKWYAWLSRNTFYAVRSTPRVNGKQKNIKMHREIVNAPEGVLVDHCNGDGLDNTKKNVRLCVYSQNKYNQKYPYKNNKLGIKGVYWDKRKKKFIAQIQYNKNNIRLGYYNVLGDADSAYRKAEEKYFGEFARAI